MRHIATQLGRKLTARQDKAVAILAVGSSVEAVAERVGISRQTIHRWMLQPDFKAAVTAARRQAVQVVFDTLSQSVNQAAEKLTALVKSQTESICLRSCEILLRFAKEHIEIGDLVERLDAIERRLDSGGN
jgi:transposase-like protein